MEELRNYIGGRLVPPASKAFLDSWEPATGRVYSRVPDSDAHDVEQAVAAAAAAAPGWAATPPAARGTYLRRLAAAIEDRAEELARAESIDTGKTLAAAREVDIPRSRLNFEFFADAATQFSSEAHPGPGAINYTLRDPLGVVACVSPWNLPLYLLTWKIAPALAVGNCVVAKPSEITPMTAHLLSRICIDQGLPEGVLNIVHGAGPKVGASLCRHTGVSAISFTGSTRTGAEIAGVAAPSFKKLSLEMGGKNPNVVFADCDFEQAVDASLKAAFSNQGQICLCGSRILVERTIYAPFRDALVERARRLKVGDPLEPDVDQGALVSKAHFEKVLRHLELARQEGGRILCGGRAAEVAGRCRDGWFVEPTLIEGLAPECQTNQEEIFGPVATLIPFDTEEEALEAANSVRYGLAATLWTRDLSRAHRFSARLKTGIVWVNCWMLRDLRTPFGGMKDSGLGREGGQEALRFFTEPKNVCVKI